MSICSFLASQIYIDENLTLKTLYEYRKWRESMFCLDESVPKPNFSQLARQLHVDRRTVRKYYMEGPPSGKRNRKCLAAAYEETIRELLVPLIVGGKNKGKTFRYIRHLYDHMKKHCGLKISEGAFRRYIQSIPEFACYFRGGSSRNIVIRYETDPGDLAQIDWKESIPMEVTDQKLPDLKVHVFVFKMAYSRTVMLKLTLQMTQDVLFSSLTEIFETLGGVPKRIMVDNMKTAMEIPRTRGNPGKVNAKFQEFAKDFGFEVVPCPAHHPQEKGKVESFMKKLDILRACSGKVTLEELQRVVATIAAQYNLTENPGTGRPPLELLEKEKSLLLHLPGKQIRDSYKSLKGRVKVNRSAHIVYQTNEYSVPPRYIGKYLEVSVSDGFLYLYHNTEYVARHRLSTGTHIKNYLAEHEIALWQMSFPHMDKEKASEAALSNLKKIGALYHVDA